MLANIAAKYAAAMAQPTASLKAFAAIVNKVFYANYKPNQADLTKLFDLCASETGFVKSFNSNHDDSGALVRRVVGKKAPYLTLRDVNNNAQGKGPSGSTGSVLNAVPGLVGKGGSKGTAKGKGTGKGRGKNQDEHFSQLVLADDFYDAKAKKMSFIDPEEIGEGATGVAQMDTNLAQKFIEALYEQEPFELPLAILMAGVSYTSLVKDQRHLVTRYSPTMIEIPVKRGNAGGPRTTKALLLQLGPSDNHVHFSDPTVTHALANDNHTTKTIVAVRRSTVPANLFDKMVSNPKSFHDYIMGALGTANFIDESSLRPMRPRDVEWGSESTQELRAFAFMRNSRKRHAFYRSGTQGAFIRTAERDEEFVVANLPVKTTLAEATSIHRRLPAGLSEGVVTTAKGYAIRCVPENKNEVEKQVRPDDAETYGELFSLQREHAAQYIVRGVDNEVSGPTLHTSLNNSIGWKIRPVKPLRSAAWGRRDWIVWAHQDDPPNSTFLCLTTTSGMAMRIEIDELPFTAKPTFWQKIANNIADKEDEDDADVEDMDYDCEDEHNENAPSVISSVLRNRWSQKGWVDYTETEWKSWRGKNEPSAAQGTAPEAANVHSMSANDDDGDDNNGNTDDDEYKYPWDDLNWVHAMDDIEDPDQQQQQVDKAAQEEQRRRSAEAELERQRLQEALILQQQQARAEAEAQQQLIAQQQQQLQQQQAAALAATTAANAAAEAAQQQRAQQQQAATTAAATNSTTSALIAQMQAAQTEQDRRISQLTANVDRTVADGAALTALVQGQADSLAQLGDSVTKLTTNFDAMNKTMASILEKMTILTQDKEAKSSTEPAPPTTATRGRRPAAPPTSTNVTEGHEAEKRGRSRSGSRPLAKSIAIADDDNEDEAADSEAQRTRVSQ